MLAVSADRVVFLVNETTACCPFVAIESNLTSPIPFIGIVQDDLTHVLLPGSIYTAVVDNMLLLCHGN